MQALFVCFLNTYTNILYKISFLVIFLHILVPNSENDTKKIKKSVDKVALFCYTKSMINTKINKRITVTLPLPLVARLNEYCRTHFYTGYSEPFRNALELFLETVALRESNSSC